VDEAGIAEMVALADYPTLEASEESYRERLTANERFHLAVASASHNGNLVELVRHSLLQHNRVLSLGVERPILSGSVPQHHAIVDAIRAHDVAGSREAMRMHLEDAHLLVMDFLTRGRLRGVGLA
jgi:DNA-binding GntR family transcriptional regulator